MMLKKFKLTKLHKYVFFKKNTDSLCEDHFNSRTLIDKLLWTFVMYAIENDHLVYWELLY